MQNPENRKNGAANHLLVSSALKSSFQKKNVNAWAGVGEPYTADEFISLLIHRNWEQLQSQLAELDTCKKCGSVLPEGCGGLFKGESDCWHTKDAKVLSL